MLYPSMIRNLLVHLAIHGLIAARWTAAIHEEWIRNLLEDRPDLIRERLERTRGLMEKAVPDAEVTEYEWLIPRLSLPDPDDCHVLAAAIQAGAGVIVTSNLEHFPATTLNVDHIEALSPDALLCRLLNQRRSDTAEAVEAMRVTLNNPPYTWDELVERFNAVGLIQASDLLRR